MTSHSESDASPILTAGQILREARLQAGVHVAVLSVNLKVSVRQLEALEANVFDADKGPVFYRGLASSVCRQLNIDPAPVLALLPRPPSQLAAVKHVQQPVKSRHTGLNRSGTFQGRVTSKVFGLGVLLLALTLSFLWMPSPLQWSWWDVSRLPWSSNHNPAEVTQEVSIVNSPVRSDALSLSTSGVTLSPSVASLPMAGLAPAWPKEASAVTDPSAGWMPNASISVPWVFSASAESWLELRDSKNLVVWSGILKAGDTTRIESPLPVRVVVGRAQAVSVTLRGAAFDLKPHTQVTVARFEVKE